MAELGWQSIISPDRQTKTATELKKLKEYNVHHKGYKIKYYLVRKGEKLKHQNAFGMTANDPMLHKLISGLQQGPDWQNMW